MSAPARNSLSHKNPITITHLDFFWMDLFPKMEPISNSPGLRWKVLEAGTAGYRAMEAAAMEQEARIAGTTSKGVFIGTETKSLLYASVERFRSPITINIPGEYGPLRTATSGMPVKISPALLDFPALELSISLEKASVWQASFPLERPLSLVEQKNRLVSASQRIHQSGPATDLAFLLAAFPDQQLLYSLDLAVSQANGFPLSEPSNPLEQSDLIAFLTSSLGAGNGLTPQGDDLVIGFLLALNRWGGILSPMLEPLKFNDAIVRAAYRRTNTLSANLIECAAQGQADERLVAALDWLVNGRSPDPSPIEDLLNWGHSSGRAVLLGFLLALAIQDPSKVLE